MGPTRGISISIMIARRVEKRDPATGAVLGTFESIKAAADDVDGKSPNIHKVCAGKARTAYGFAWAYAPSATVADTLEGEEWKPFGHVRVSSFGRVERQTPNGLVVVEPANLARSGLYRVLMIDGKSWPIQRLVMHLFGGGVADNEKIKFKNGNKDDPRLSNLERATNKREAPPSTHGAKRPVVQLSHDGTLVLNKFESVSAAARATNTDTSSIVKCARGIIPHAGKCVWKYA